VSNLVPVTTAVRNEKIKNLDLNISETVLKSDTWKTDTKTHVKEVVVEDEKFHKGNSDIRFRVFDEIPKET